LIFPAFRPDLGPLSRLEKLNLINSPDRIKLGGSQFRVLGGKGSPPRVVLSFSHRDLEVGGDFPLGSSDYCSFQDYGYLRGGLRRFKPLQPRID